MEVRFQFLAVYRWVSWISASQTAMQINIREARQHMIEALRALARDKCSRNNCGTVCLCASCHARKALEFYDPEWRP
jgi:hypothetical protein